MREFQHKKRTRGLIYSFPVIILLVFFLFVLAKGSFGAYQKRSYAGEKSKEAALALDLLKAREEELEERIARQKSEQGKEEELREKFLVGKEGEGVVFIVDAPLATSTNSGENKRNFWTRFLGWFQ
ncbi:hypothetical protein L0Y69_02280 [bacterium]|nr:hypothetical protein [bacterium]